MYRILLIRTTDSPTEAAKLQRTTVAALIRTISSSGVIQWTRIRDGKNATFRGVVSPNIHVVCLSTIIRIIITIIIRIVRTASSFYLPFKGFCKKPYYYVYSCTLDL